ncbi:HD domain-containing protein [Oceanobacillus sp. 143]|uniref:HD-GYP domain-containing protein n=1 Tax=Oceanobacillus zhaokaii TaxID=2052660 RepID=A0A345PBW8_9BACI|nr:HD-GYP domain-containing protein [Oceanobacillus zhaokaii]AXI07498.1 HD-GYP domain-containing protein [Oceanobacillus zhaokaii]QGS67740.1 HD domain-containing protein [Oceanobacillus sp. 143]
MLVEPSQLIPGCVLIRDVNGKSNRPIIPENTVLTDEHIIVLQKYLVQTVAVASKLINGDKYIPKPIDQKKVIKQEQLKTKQASKQNQSFSDQFNEVVANYKTLFNQWQNGMPIDIPAVRKLIIPLLERIENINIEAYTLHHDTTKSEYIYYHSVAVGILSAYLGKKLDYPKGEWLQIGLAGFLSDSGMAKIDPKIISKASYLTDSEFAEIKKHPTYAYRLLEHLPAINPAVKLAVLQHHERLDGSGYPLGLTQDKIHIYSRIIAIADTYYAMTSDRLYREKKSAFQVIEELQKEQYSRLDYQIVKVFIHHLINVAIGSQVVLSNGQIGKIIFVDSDHPTRPIIQLIDSDELIVLKDMPDLYIEKVMKD